MNAKNVVVKSGRLVFLVLALLSVAALAGARPGSVASLHAQPLAAVAINNVTEFGITTNSVAIRWDSPYAKTSVIEYGTTSSYGMSTPEEPLAFFHDQKLTGLSEDTTYYYRIRGNDYYGYGFVSGQHTFRTLTQTNMNAKITAARKAAAGNNTYSPLGQNYYVSTAGSDANDGLTTDHAWRNIYTSVDRLLPGDTLYVRSGTYSGAPGNCILIGKSGIDIAPITLKAYEPDQKRPVTRDCIYLYNAGADSKFSAVIENVVIDGFEADGTNMCAVYNEVHNYTCRNNYLHDLEGVAINVTNDVPHVGGNGSSWITLENNKIERMPASIDANTQ